MVHGQVIGIPFRRRKGEQAPPPPKEVAWNPNIESNASFGGYINVERVNRPENITYQTTESYNGIPIIKGSGIDTKGLVIGAVTNNYWKVIFYKLMLYSKTIDMLSINALKNLFALDILIDINHPIFKK